jgi:hypothetical protein
MMVNRSLRWVRLRYMKILSNIERIEREREIKSAIGGGHYRSGSSIFGWLFRVSGGNEKKVGYIYSSKYFIENP